MNKVAVVSLDKKRNARARREAEAEIKKEALRILKKLRKDGVFLEIFLADSGKMRFLNRKYRGRDKLADVLSFKEPENFPHPELEMRHIGEIYLNLEKTTDHRLQPTAKQKKAVVRSLWTVDRLLIHAILHLFGYGHNKKSDRIKMEKMERIAMQKMRIHANDAK